VKSDNIGRSFLIGLLAPMQRPICQLSAVRTTVKIFPFRHVGQYCDWSWDPWVFHLHVMAHFGRMTYLAPK